MTEQPLDIPAARVAEQTHRWVVEVVVGLGLCPFARGPVESGRLRLTVSSAREVDALLVDLVVELGRLAEADPDVLETTLLIHPHCLRRFADYVDFLDDADAILEAEGHVGEIQIASFHPDYRFAGADPEAPENYTNRSPHPMLHLIRESSVARAVAGHPDVAGIPAANIALLRSLDPRQLEDWRRGRFGAAGRHRRSRGPKRS